MCLAIPGKVVNTYDQRGLRMAKVQFGSIVREACLEYVPPDSGRRIRPVHVGFAISRVDEAEVERTYQALKDLDQRSSLAAARRNIESVRPLMQIFEVSAKSGSGMREVLQFLRDQLVRSRETLPALQIETTP